MTTLPALEQVSTPEEFSLTRATMLPTSNRGSTRALGAVSVSLLSIPLGMSFASSAPVTSLATSVPPPPTKALPSELDVAPKYQQGYRCLSGDRPGPVAFAKLLNEHYGHHVWGVNRACALEHGEGRALDWMVNAKTASGLELGNAITRWLAAPDSAGRPGAMARRFGINYIIWNRQMWRAYDPNRGWAPYTGSSPHTDHIHISFTWDGAYQQTSWWTGKALLETRYTGPTDSAGTPIPASTPTVTPSGYPLLKRGDNGKDVMLAQGVLGLTKDGSFGPATETTLRSWQSRNGVAVTGQLDNATWTKMIDLDLVPERNGTAPVGPLTAYVNTTIKYGSSGPAVSALQKALGGLDVDGKFGPATESKVKAFQATHKINPTGIVAKSTWEALIAGTSKPPTHPLAPYAKLVLKRGSTGAPVLALQKELKISADGAYGPATQAAVIRFQKSKGITPSGVVASATWAALMGEGSTGTPSPPMPPTQPPSDEAPPKPASLSTQFTPYLSTVLRSGSKGTPVKVLQAGLGGIAVDGSFGSATAARVVAFQKSVGLTATGVVDKATWTKLELSVHPLLPYWGTVAKRGSSGANVKALQSALKITADGSYGPSTESAVKAAQTQAKIATTGVVATVTWRAIEKQM